LGREPVECRCYVYRIPRADGDEDALGLELERGQRRALPDPKGGGEGGGEPRRATLRTMSAVASLVLVLLAGGVIRWGPGLRGDAARYLAHTLDAQWFVLPVAQQTPMSAWNRTPLQALIALGLPAAPAQVVAGLVWLAALGASAWLVRDRRLSFAPAFALAFALLYLGQPVGWTLVDLDLVVCVAAWPALPRVGRALLLVEGPDVACLALGGARADGPGRGATAADAPTGRSALGNVARLTRRLGAHRVGSAAAHEPGPSG